jgi:hypothetical protein
MSSVLAISFTIVNLPREEAAQIIECYPITAANLDYPLVHTIDRSEREAPLCALELR